MIYRSATVSYKIEKEKGKIEKETHVELLDVRALSILRRHDPRADDLDRARAAPVATSHLRV